jgi:hypothetical protein
MSKISEGLTAGLVALAVVALAPEPASAQAQTPRGCHWTSRSDGMLELWCQNDIGDSYFTGQLMEPSARPSSDSGCPAGTMYDGVRCVGKARKPRAVAKAAAPAASSAEAALPASAAPAEVMEAPETAALPAEPKHGGGPFGWLASIWAAIVAFFRGLFGH